MTAQSIDTFVLIFSDPALNVADPQRERAILSFDLLDDTHIRTLSTHNAGEEIEGLLYVPDLDSSDLCFNTSTDYIPSSVTRKADLPSTGYHYIAFAPWISAPCTKSYLAATSNVDAFIFYVPDDSINMPPQINDKTWDLKDGGKWKSQNKYPVYALPGLEGGNIMQHLAQYSSNSDISQGILARGQFDPSDYVRLCTRFTLRSGTNVPTLWAFLLIVLGLVILIVAATSFAMHFYQGRNRRALQRRVENGEVDLESLGIKRLRVPQDAIDKLDTIIYVPTEEESDDKGENMDHMSQSPPDPVLPISPAPNQFLWSQPTCPICLEDFAAHQTTVRSLPCHHIYHPACIDAFLRDSSSLCPVCKARALPANTSYSGEPITNAMVRYERRMRRMNQTRELRRRSREIDDLNARAHGTPAQGDGRWLWHLWSGRRTRVFSVSGARTSSQVEMGTMGTPAASNPNATSIQEVRGSVVRPPPTVVNLRGERMRRGVSALQTRSRTLHDEEMADLARPKWRKAAAAVFPGFR